MTERTRKDNGVTLIELMIVLVIAAILVAGIYTLFMTQQRSYFVQDQVTGVQQDARAALNIMARDIRMAGFVAGAGSATGFTDGSNPITIPSKPAGDTYRYAVEPRNSTTAPDTLTVFLGAEELGVVQTVAGSLVTLDDLDTNAPFANAVNNDIAFIAFDLRVGRLYKVSNVDFSKNEITVLNFSSDEKTVGGKAYWVKAITYSVTNAGALRRNENTGAGSQPIAGDGISTIIEDLQFAYQLEGDAGWYNAPADFPAGKTAADIRMIRINIIVKTTVPDPKETGFFKPACEDRGRVDSDPGNRRRVYTTEVKVRNL
jgi:prepilin-type N-terminal cleavage/methylation domain-containing protein